VDLEDQLDRVDQVHPVALSNQQVPLALGNHVDLADLVGLVILD
jgi:hypothetical protein